MNSGKHDVSTLHPDALFLLWTIFNRLAETNDDKAVIIPIVVDYEELSLLLGKMGTFSGLQIQVDREQKLQPFSFKKVLIM